MANKRDAVEAIAISILAAFGIFGMGAIVGGIETNDQPTIQTEQAQPDKKFPTVELYESIFNNSQTRTCEYEDASDLRGPNQMCKWDAKANGNGVGVSFVVYTTDNGPIFIYADGHIEE